MDQALELRRPPRPDRNLRGVEGKLGAKRGGDVPANDPAAEDVDREGWAPA